MQEAAFASNGNLETDKFKFITGENALTAYKASQEQTKYFCKYCGSPILSRNKNQPNNIRVRLGTIESDITKQPEAHLFVKSKANGEDIQDDLPQFDAYQLKPRALVKNEPHKKHDKAHIIFKKQGVF